MLGLRKELTAYEADIFGGNTALVAAWCFKGLYRYLA